MPNNDFRMLLIAAIALGFTLFYSTDLSNHLSFETLKAEQAQLQAYQAQHPITTLLTYTLLYIVLTSLSIPGATLLTLAGGALFGLFWGTVIVSIVSTLGATVAFLSARFLFRNSIQTKFGDQLDKINQGIAKDGAFYLFSLRLLPVFPFFMVNLLMGLTSMKTSTYFWISQLGMLAGTLVYVNAGTALAEIRTPADIVSPTLILSFALLGVFPLIAKKAITHFIHG